jgi:hypothetical protein
VSDYHYSACAISLGYKWCTCVHIQDRRDAMHAAGEAGLLGRSSLCGIEAAEGRSLWLTSIPANVNCAVCKSLGRTHE